MTENTDDSDAALIADLSEIRTTSNGSEYPHESSLSNDDKPKEGASKRRKLKQQSGKAGETSEARRESHKIIEQRRRQKINDKINELRELLNYPDGSQNKAVVLQAAVDNIKNLKVVCSKLLSAHRQLQEEYLQVLAENERLRKDQPEIKRSRLPDTPFLFDDPFANFQQSSTLTLTNSPNPSHINLNPVLFPSMPTQDDKQKI